ncbi:MAG TPA: cytochrome b N-terminal domain-containing protein [Alphaproteobacteria bacterium]|nr:cytochrome b N-terminal domain-containing protein [Alphaproteobacteria bacterium]
MTPIKRALRRGFEPAERLFDHWFSPTWNPFYHLGALGFFYYWIVAVSGIYLYVFFDTGTTEAYESIEALTVDQWYLGGVMRSLHRYASDGLVLMIGVHMLREFSLDRYRGVRWFTWFTGVPIVWLVVICGITGYWLVWDKLAQYIAVATTELLDTLPIFGEPIARNFLSSASLDDRFFTLMMFMHIAVPLFLLFVLWIHLQRVTKPRIHPPRGLAAGTFAMMLVLSFVFPAVSQGPADLDAVPANIGLDWFYLWGYPLIDRWSGGTWAFAAVVTLLVAALPWMPSMRRARPAVVHLDNCNGCSRCADDCPYAAISMEPRSDGLPFEREAVVNPKLCVSCGLCAGACPTAMPFRRRSALIPGIELADFPVAELRARLLERSAALSSQPRILVVGCAYGNNVESLAREDTAAIRLPCIGALPPSFIDFALSRNLAEGVLLTGCGEAHCFNRFGIEWTKRRLAGTRDPHLRARMPRDRLALCWAGPAERQRLARELEAFRSRLKALEPVKPGAAISRQKVLSDA